MKYDFTDNGNGVTASTKHFTEKGLDLVKIENWENVKVRYWIYDIVDNDNMILETFNFSHALRFIRNFSR